MREKSENILYPYALNESGAPVAAKTAPAGANYYCIGCGQRMVVRRGPKNQPHFAHGVETNACSPETVLHLLAKEAIKRGIEGALHDSRPYEFEWRCSVCGARNRGNLAVTPRRVLVEKELDTIRPDLLAVTESNKPLVAIEIVVTHAPTAETLGEYGRRKLPVAIVEEVDWDDLADLKQSLLHMSVRVLNASCRSPSHPPACRSCRHPMESIEIEVWQGYTCYQCHRPMPVLFFPKFLWNDVQSLKALAEQARRWGVPFVSYKTKQGGQNAAHQCPGCGAWQRNLFVYNGRYDNWHPEPDEPVETVSYFWCQQCEVWEPKQR